MHSIALTSSGGGGGGGGTSSVAYTLLYDPGSGNYFVRKTLIDNTGAETVSDVGLDLTSLFTPSGVPEVPNSDKYDLFSKKMWDDDTSNNNGIVPFTRIYIVRNEFGSSPITSQSDVDASGNNYSVQGTVREFVSIKFEILNDLANDFIRKYYVDEGTGETFYREDVSLSDGQSPYSTVGPEAQTYDYAITITKRHDFQGGSVYIPYYNVQIYRSGQQVTNNTIDEGGATYTPIGTPAPGVLTKTTQYIDLDDVSATTGARTPFVRKIDFIEGVQTASANLDLTGAPYTPTGVVQKREQLVEFRELKIVAKEILNFTDAAAVGLASIPAQFAGAQIEVQINQGDGFYARYETFDSVANPPTQTQGFSIGHRQVVVMGHTPSVRMDDKLEISRFRIRGEVGVTGKCHVYYYGLV